MARRRMMAEAIPEYEYEMLQKGQIPPERPDQDHKEPQMPDVSDLVTRGNIPIDQVKSVSGVKRVVRNPEGYIFIGFDIKIQTENNQTIKGWIPESELNWLRDNLRGRMELDQVSY